MCDILHKLGPLKNHFLSVLSIPNEGTSISPDPKSCSQIFVDKYPMFGIPKINPKLEVEIIGTNMHFSLVERNGTKQTNQNIRNLVLLFYL